MLADKISRSLGLIRSATFASKNSTFLGHSGGKDSCVILYLTKIVCPTIRVVHNPKVSTHEKTIEFLYTLGMEHKIELVPFADMSYYIRTNNLSIQIDGSRRDEATRTDGRSTNIIKNGKDVNREDMPEIVKGGIFGLTILYPIVSWTDKEVWEFIRSRKIPVSEEYHVDDVV